MIVPPMGPTVRGVTTEDDVRRIALSLPETTEKPRAPKRVLKTYDDQLPGGSGE